MKKNTSSNAQDGSHAEGAGNNVPSTGKKGKTNNSQGMTDMLRDSPEQKAGRNKNQKKDGQRQNASGKK